MILRVLDAACSHEADSTQGDSMVVHDQSNNPVLASKWQALLTEYADVFEQPREPISRPVDHCIDLLDPNAVLPKSRLYRISEDKLKAVKDTINNYLAYGWIRLSTGSYRAPIIVIQKKTGELRIYIDYWLLNKQTRLDSYPILHIDELLDRITSAKYFNKIDLASGYHQIKMANGHKEKTAFFTRYSIYEWVVLPLRLKNAPATFQRLMYRIFHDFFDKMLLVYLDNLPVYSDTDVQHLENIRQVLQHLCDNKLKAKKKKCDFTAQQVEYLWHYISNVTVVMYPSKVSAVK